MPYAPYSREKEPRKRTFIIPADNQPWGALNKFDFYSRHRINDVEFDDLVNFLPMGNTIRQVPGLSTNIATLASTVVWLSAQILNGGVFIFALCQNGHIYQVSIPGGVITDVTTSTSISSKADITNWQGTTILFSDVNASKVYSWNGTTFATVFSAQPAAHVEVFNNRLWMANNSTITFTANGTFNSLSGDSGSFVITDNDAVNPIVGLKSYLGQLYIWGSNFIQVLGNLVDTGSPAVTQFQKYTLESQIGILTEFSLVPLGVNIYFANSYGVWQLSGGVANKISEAVDGFFTNLTSNSSYSGGYCQIYSEPVLCWHAQWAGDNNHTVICMNSDGRWFRAVFGTITFITSITSSAITNNVPTVWGTDGTNIFQLFSNTSTTVTSSFNSKYFSIGSLIQYKKFLKIGILALFNAMANMTATLFNESAVQLGAAYSSSFPGGQLIFINNSGGVIQFQNNSLANINFTTTQVQMYSFQMDGPGTYRALGINYSLTSIGAVVMNIILEIEPSESAWGP
jgi:hypothetical protein